MSVSKMTISLVWRWVMCSPFFFFLTFFFLHLSPKCKWFLRHDLCRFKPHLTRKGTKDDSWSLSIVQSSQNVHVWWKTTLRPICRGKKDLSTLFGNPLIYQFHSRIEALVCSSFANDLFWRISASFQNLFVVVVTWKRM